MVAARTADELVTEASVKALLADADARLTSAEKLRFADEVLTTRCAQILVTSRSQRWTHTASDVSIVSGTYLYAVPGRALAAGVTDILITDGTTEWSAPEVGFPDAHRFRVNGGPWDSPFAYCWRDDQVEILPHPTTSSYSLRVLYPRQPSKLVLVAACAPITAVGASTVTATSVATLFGSTATVDIVQGSYHAGVRGIDLSASNSGSTCTVTVPTGTAVGDYVCLAGTTCIPPIPQSLWPVLVHGLALEMLVAITDTEAASVMAVKLEAAEKMARDILKPRSRGATKKAVNPYTPLRLLRGG